MRGMASLGLALVIGALTPKLQAGEVAVPRVLSEPARISARALGNATLAVARAGQRLVAVGERGTALWSDDGGHHWQQAQVPVQVTLTALRFLDARTGWAVGHLGVILRSDDGGQHWHKQFDGVQAAHLAGEQAAHLDDEVQRRRARHFAEDGPDKPFLDVDFADVRHGVAVGAFGMAFATEDGGQHWQPLMSRLPNPRSLHLYGVRFLARSLVVVGEQGLILRSEDGGGHFEPVTSPYKGSLFGVLVTRSGALVAYGLRGHALRSIDQGRSWDELSTGTSTSLSAATELEDGSLLLLGQTGELLRSADDGRSFTRALPAAGPLPVAGLASADSHTLALASLRGMRRQPLP